MAKLKRKKIGLAVLANKTNLGPKASEVQFVLLILSPKREVSYIFWNILICRKKVLIILIDFAT